MQLQVMNSPFNQEQAELLNRLLPTFTESQKVWLSGYLAGAASAPIASVIGVPSQQTADVSSSKEVTILYGSQTGNARGLAKKAGTTLEGKGFQVTVSAMSDFKPNNIKKVKNLLILVSTHGEGDPPDNALT
ncbi:flavodoxin domain-containing protein, partial [Neobacillus drentensis]|uniref:flavodoxin domain-containing protein n=1 Tax=Neobacillus drentensis TaxID=220684 RepID=UPI002FFE4EF7